MKTKFFLIIIRPYLTALQWLSHRAPSWNGPLERRASTVPLAYDPQGARSGNLCTAQNIDRLTEESCQHFNQSNFYYIIWLRLWSHSQLRSISEQLTLILQVFDEEETKQKTHHKSIKNKIKNETSIFVPKWGNLQFIQAAHRRRH